MDFVIGMIVGFLLFLSGLCFGLVLGYMVRNQSSASNNYQG